MQPASPAEHRRQLAYAVRRLLEGKMNGHGAITLTTGSATTTINNALIGFDSIILLMPTSASAAADG